MSNAIERPQLGRSAPEVNLPAADGSPWSLSDHRGKSVVFIFHRHIH